MKYALKKIRTASIFLAAMLMIITFQSCSEDSVTTGSDNLEFSAMSNSESTITGNSLVLDTVKILIKDINLNVSNNNQDSANFKTGPFVLYLNLFSQVNTISTSMIPEGSYDKIRFGIHKLNNNESVPDPDFADANGTYSVIVKGRYNGAGFTYKSSKSAHQKISFPNILQVSSSGKANITLLVKPYIWFVGNNNVYLDPMDPSNSNNIDNNIKDNINNNFHCFLDNDKNGVPD